MSPFPRRAAAPVIAVAGLGIALGGCVTLLPASKPATLYRFEATVGGAKAPAATRGDRFAVRIAPLAFERAAAGDRILTIDGDKAAYIAGARWVVPAPTLFEAAIGRAFDERQARLLAPAEPSAADYVLKLDVRTFEARYGPDAKAPPTVVVEVYGALIDRVKPDATRTHLFRASAPATSNSVHAIVTAFDTAVGAVLADTAVWVDAKGAG